MRQFLRICMNKILFVVTCLTQQNRTRISKELLEAVLQLRWLNYFNPRTSCISYNPEGFPASHKAAFKAPLAKVSLLEAL